MYPAAVAKELGLVREVWPAAELMSRVRGVAETIAKRAPLAVQAAKRAMVRGLATDPDTASALERWSFGQVFATKDAREGTRAFVEKREPVFKGE